MRAVLAVHLKDGNVEIVERDLPRVPPGFALIELLYAGICNTDLELQRGYYGFEGTPGHEFVGKVVESENLSLRGRRVVGEINLACGTCDWCARGLGRHCPTRTVLGIVKHPGAFAEFLVLPERNLHVVPDSIPTEHAVFIEPLGAACEVLDQVEIPANAPVAVLGDGKLGLLIAQVLQAHGAKVHQFGRHKEKLRIAEKRGVTGEVAGTQMPIAEYEWVVDATGSSEGLKIAASMTRPRGTIILKSTLHGEVAIDTAPVIVNELTLVGSRCGRFEPALALLAAGKINVADMISAQLPLSQAPQAFELAANRGVLKVLLRGA
jgi:2-desacetyl-2-hydroxyethyl bacteriochlorophyllide A dehydrogenase